jgi:hypothetical protein
MHHAVLRAANAVRRNILRQHGPDVLPACYTGHCTCDFLNHLRREFPSSVAETAIYTRNDGIIDWRYCRTKNPEVDFEVPGTHIGMVFNTTVYTILANRLAQARTVEDRA